MRLLTWDYTLEEAAQQWASVCRFEHGSPQNDLVPYTNFGQNLYAGTGGIDVRGAIQAWYDEVGDYNYQRDSCTPGKVCGHYTQVVWAETYSVGCGFAFCPNLRNFQLNNAYFMVCNYGPAGNLYGNRPYTAAAGYTKCSQCSAGWTICQDTLCDFPGRCDDITCKEGEVMDSDRCICTPSNDQKVPGTNRVTQRVTRVTSGPTSFSTATSTSTTPKPTSRTAKITRTTKTTTTSTTRPSTNTPDQKAPNNPNPRPTNTSVSTTTDRTAFTGPGTQQVVCRAIQSTGDGDSDSDSDSDSSEEDSDDSEEQRQTQTGEEEDRWNALDPQQASQICTDFCHLDAVQCPRDRCSCAGTSRSGSVTCSSLPRWGSRSRVRRFCSRCTNITTQCFKYCTCA